MSVTPQAISQNTNLFEVLGLTPTFDQEIAAIEKSYIAMQQKTHPDRLIGKPAPERQQAILLSMRVNEAYQTIKNPLKRAQHLLWLSGITVGSEKDSVKPSHALLVDVMERREQVEEAKNIAELGLLEENTQKHYEETLESIAQSFRQNDLQNAAQMTIRLGYLQKLLEDIRLLRKQRS